MNKNYRHLIYLIFMLSVSVVGISYIGIGVKNYTESDEIAQLIEPSRAYESYGYKSIDEWQTSFENESLKKIGIGLGIIALIAGIGVFNSRKKS